MVTKKEETFLWFSWENNEADKFHFLKKKKQKDTALKRCKELGDMSHLGRIKKLEKEVEDNSGNFCLLFG